MAGLRGGVNADCHGKENQQLQARPRRVGMLTPQMPLAALWGYCALGSDRNGWRLALGFLAAQDNKPIKRVLCGQTSNEPTSRPKSGDGCFGKSRRGPLVSRYQIRFVSNVGGRRPKRALGFAGPARRSIAGPQRNRPADGKCRQPSRSIARCPRHGPVAGG
jgi:hypothetical protein